MLARLDQELAPFRSSVNEEGNLLRVHGPAGEPDLVARVVAIVQELAYVAEPLDPPVTVARWFGTKEIDELSQEEAHVLAKRWASELETEGLTTGDRIAEPLRLVLLDAFHDAARRGTVENLGIDQTPIRTALKYADASLVVQWIEQKLGNLPVAL